MTAVLIEQHGTTVRIGVFLTGIGPRVICDWNTVTGEPAGKRPEIIDTKGEIIDPSKLQD